MTPYRRRLVDELIDELSAQLPALFVIGPRATGKTTTLSRRAATIVRLDREIEAAAFVADPDAALRGLSEPVLVDEWQVVPGVLGAVRRAVDADPRPGRFFVTGSVRAQVRGETWPATGRLVRLTMHPMSIREQEGRVGGGSFFDKVANGEDLATPDDPPDLRDYVQLALRSGFPDPALRLTGRSRVDWLESYLEDLLTHDIEQLEDVTRRRDTRRLRRYLEAYALSSAGVVSHKKIYDSAGINRITADAYEGLLSDLLIAEHVPAWATNRLKRLVSQPKRYLVDAALIAASLRVDEQGVMRDGNLLGRIIDTFATAQLRAELAISLTRPRLYHLRAEQGRHEVDLVAELAGRRLVGIEIKAGGAPNAADDAKHLRWLRDQMGGRFVAGVVLHTGPRVYPLDEMIVAAPISVLWG